MFLCFSLFEVFAYAELSCNLTIPSSIYSTVEYAFWLSGFTSLPSPYRKHDDHFDGDNVGICIIINKFS